MTYRAVPNLPSRDFDATVAFYGRLGFAQEYRNGGWLILRGDDLTLEFFPFANLDPTSSFFICSIRVDDVDAVPRHLGGRRRGEDEQRGRVALTPTSSGRRSRRD